MGFQVVWAEVPVLDIERAQKFYEAVFGLAGDGIVDDGTRKTTTLKMTEGAAGFSLTQTADFEPRDDGVLVYLMLEEPAADTLKKITDAGGKVIVEKTSMGDGGFYATFQDTEGNVLALYAME